MIQDSDFPLHYLVYKITRKLFPMTFANARFWNQKLRSLNSLLSDNVTKVSLGMHKSIFLFLVERKTVPFPQSKFIHLFKGSYRITHDSDSMLEVKDFTVNDYILNDAILTLNILLNYQILHAIDPYYCLIERRLFCPFTSDICVSTENMDQLFPSF